MVVNQVENKQNYIVYNFIQEYNKNMNKENKQLHLVSNITALAAIDAIKAAFAEAEKVGIKISVTIVDSSLNLVAFSRGDGATPHSSETSRRKANTAASTGKATGWMSSDLAITLPLASNNLLTNVPGGVPFRFEGILVGGLGIAGGTVEQDSQIAQATLTAIGADSIIS